jgi:hypothetical protein
MLPAIREIPYIRSYRIKHPRHSPPDMLIKTPLTGLSHSIAIHARSKIQHFLFFEASPPTINFRYQPITIQALDPARQCTQCPSLDCISLVATELIGSLPASKLTRPYSHRITQLSRFAAVFPSRPFGRLSIHPQSRKQRPRSTFTRKCDVGLPSDPIDLLE